MGQVIVDITLSLDGFIAGPNISSQQPMGKGGLRLHDWLFNGKTDADAKLLDEVVATSGAVIVGGRTYKTAIEDAWGGATPFEVPAFVLTNVVPEKAVKGFTYVTDGIASAMKQAKAVAGDKNVWVMGGANAIQQFLKAGLIHELQIHIAPVLLGEGTRLFEQIGTQPIELDNTRVIQTPAATHLRFRVLR